MFPTTSLERIRRIIWKHNNVGIVTKQKSGVPAKIKMKQRRTFEFPPDATETISRRRTRLFEKGALPSWKIPFSLHPTQSECVFTQPPPRANLRRAAQTHESEGTEEQSRPEGQTSQEGTRP